MSEDQARRLKKIDFLKSVGSTPERKIEEIGRELGIARTGSYKYLQEFIENAVLTDNEPDFPRKLLLFYNNGLPENEERLVDADVEALRPWIEDYYAKHLPRHEETINNQEDSNRTMSSYNPSEEQWRRTDRSTDTGLLRTLLLNAKIVHPSVIDRFIEQYEINRENFNKNPLSLLDYMKHVFSNAQGEQIWKIFQESRGKYVYGADGQPKPAMDPMLLMMMMQGGGFNPAMMGMMNQGGGDPNLMMNAMMMGQMQKEAARKQEKEDQQSQMDKIMQMLMFKMVGSSIDDKKPMYDMMGMGGMMGPPTMREVLDEGGRVKARDYIPNFQGMGHQPGQDPMSVMMVGKLMDANTQLMMKATDSSKTPLEILTTMIPFFKDQGNAATQLAGIMDTVNKVAPGFFERSREPQGGLEVYKLKFDTELAMQAQKIELAKMEHMWDVDKMDKQASAESAKNWMGMIETFGTKIVDTVGPAITNGFGKNLLGKGAGPTQPQYTPEQMQQIMRARQMQAAQAQQEEQAQQQTQQPPQAQVSSQQTQPDMSTIYLITNLQNALNQSEKDKQMLIARLNEAQAGPAQQQSNYNIPEANLQKMPDGQLREILQELGMQNQAENNLRQRIEAALANRALMGQQPVEQHEEPRAHTADDQTFNSGNAEPETASSEETRGEEESNSAQA